VPFASKRGHLSYGGCTYLKSKPWNIARGCVTDGPSDDDDRFLYQKGAPASLTVIQSITVRSDVPHALSHLEIATKWRFNKRLASNITQYNMFQLNASSKSSRSGLKDRLQYCGIEIGENILKCAKQSGDMRQSIIRTDNQPSIVIIFRYRELFPKRRSYMRCQITGMAFLPFRKTIKRMKAMRTSKDRWQIVS
jgi:hypothetical protein